jgi:hypothetical protein
MHIARGPFENCQQQQWFTWREMGLREEYSDSWKAYIDIHRNFFIKLSGEEDEFIWYLNSSRDYEPKVGYKALASEGHENPLI